MKRYLPLLLLLCGPAVLKAQIDTVAGKIKKIPTKHVDALAKFPAGDFKNYIASKLQYPHHLNHDINGQIVLLTEIGDDGTISHVTILKSLSPAIDQEIVKVVNASPKWQPAMLAGKKTDMNMVFAIDIAIKGDKKQAVASNTAKPAAIERPKIQSAQAVTPVHQAALLTRSNAVAVRNKPVVTAPKKAVAVIAIKKNAVIAKPANKPPVVKKPVAVAVKLLPPPVKKVVPPPVAVKRVIPPVKKMIPPPVKKPEPVIAKKVEPPVKKVIPPPVKKPEPVIAKKVEPPIRKLAPPPAKKPEVVAIKTPQPAKKTAAPIAPVVAKKLVALPKKETPPAKKAAATVNKPGAGQTIKTVSAATASAGNKIVTQMTPPAVKPKRKVVKGNLFKPSENNAIFPNGGLTALYHYLGENISYPPMSKAGGIEGTVMLRFVVDEEGAVTDVEVLSSPADDLSQEAIRVFLASPRWKPAKQNGTNVAVSFEIPIKFSLGSKTPPPPANN